MDTLKQLELAIKQRVGVKARMIMSEANAASLKRQMLAALSGSPDYAVATRIITAAVVDGHGHFAGTIEFTVKSEGSLAFELKLDEEKKGEQ